LRFVYFSKRASGVTIKAAYRRLCWLNEKQHAFLSN